MSVPTSKACATVSVIQSIATTLFATYLAHGLTARAIPGASGVMRLMGLAAAALLPGYSVCQSLADIYYAWDAATPVAALIRVGGAYIVVSQDVIEDRHVILLPASRKCVDHSPPPRGFVRVRIPRDADPSLFQTPSNLPPSSTLPATEISAALSQFLLAALQLLNTSIGDLPKYAWATAFPSASPYLMASLINGIALCGTPTFAVAYEVNFIGADPGPPEVPDGPRRPLMIHEANVEVLESFHDYAGWLWIVILILFLLMGPWIVIVSAIASSRPKSSASMVEKVILLLWPPWSVIMGCLYKFIEMDRPKQPIPVHWHLESGGKPSLVRTLTPQHVEARTSHFLVDFNKPLCLSALLTFSIIPIWGLILVGRQKFVTMGCSF